MEVTKASETTQDTAQMTICHLCGTQGEQRWGNLSQDYVCPKCGYSWRVDK